MLCNGWCHSPNAFNMEPAVLQVKSFALTMMRQWQKQGLPSMSFSFLFFQLDYIVSDCISRTVKDTDLP